MGGPGITKDVDLDWQFYVIGCQYFVAGRFSTLSGMSRTAANQFHHAIEMLLKARLLETHSAKELKDDFRHNLKKVWRAYKREVDKPALLDPLDDVIAGLHRWEDIRYPQIPKWGATAITISQRKPSPDAVAPKSGGTERFVHRDDSYELCLEAVDELFKAIFVTLPANAEALKAYLTDAAIAVLHEQNLHPIDW